ncbi:AAA family ATPase [Magnetovirga frankeli]|uniref:AAA family ATPase n=1 Tax=Magnetovirga frankeli TaxID=947516 RepID=UPI001293B267|nr:AAA family ATPase [gamma proteobacterium SS-5]
MIEPLCITGHGQHFTRKGTGQSYPTVALADIRDLVDNPPRVDKAQGQWLIPSSHNTSEARYLAEQMAHGSYHYLWADLDHQPPPIERTAEVLRQSLPRCCFEVYTSKSATEGRQKARILIPLDQPLSSADWVLAQQALNLILEANGITPDTANTGAVQLCLLPNSGPFYGAISERTAPFLSTEALAPWVQQMRAQIEAQEAETTKRREEARQRREQRQSAGGQSLIDAFNASYTVEDVLLQANYSQQGSRFRHPASETGSYSANVKDGRVHSLSPNDPLYTGGGGGGAHDAFSAFCVLFHDHDEKAAIRDAGDNWLSISNESWNKVQRREYAQAQAAEVDISALLGKAQEQGQKGQQAPKPAFRFIPEHELKTTPARYCIKPVLPSESVGILFGESGTFKSFLALDMGLAIAGGLDYHGMAVKTPGPVFYLAGEGHAGLAKRITGWKLHHDIGRPLPFYVSQTPAALYDARAAATVSEAITGLVEQSGGDTPSLLVVDTLMTNFGGGDYKDGNDITALLNNLVQYARIPFGCTCLVIHHVGHGEKGREAGAYQLRANSDFRISAERHGDTTTLTCLKSKDEAEWPPVSFTMQSVDLGFTDDDGEPVTTLVPVLTDTPTRTKARPMPPGVTYAADTLAQAIRANGGDKAHLEDWRAIFYDGHTADSPEAKKKAFQRARADLVNGNLAVVSGDHYRLTDCAATPWTNAHGWRVALSISGELASNDDMEEAA